MIQNDKIKIGNKVRIETVNDELYEGTVKFWNARDGDLVIEPGFCLKTKRFIADSLNFYKNDIQWITNLDEIEKDHEVDTEPKKSLSHSYSSIQNKSISNSSISVDQVSLNKEKVNVSFGENSYLKEILTELRSYPYALISESVSIINSLSKIIQSRIKLIGVNFYGNLTKNGYISVISIIYEDFVYLFDLISIKDEEEQLENEIKDHLNDILADPSIVKVMHNCASASDILFNKYHIKIRNVFDLEVAYVFIYNLNKQNPLDHSIDIELLIKENMPNIEENKLKKELNDLKNIDWLKRPLNIKTKYIILRETFFLIELYNIFYKKLLEKFIKGCDLYINIYRNCADDEKIKNYYKKNNQLIKELQNLFNTKNDVKNNLDNDFINKKRYSYIDDNNNNNNSYNESKNSKNMNMASKIEEETLLDDVIHNNSISDQIECKRIENTSKIFERSESVVKKFNFLPAGYFKCNKPKKG